MNQQTESHQSLADHGVHVEETMTKPTRPGKKPRPVWVVSGNVFGLESLFYEVGGKKYRGNWSFFSDPSEDILKELTANGRQSFSDQVQSQIERKTNRIDKFEKYSENAASRAQCAFKKVDSILSVIPPGQPILVGHQSEKRHRRDIARMDSGMRKGVEENEKADYFNHRASSLNYEIKRMTESRQYVANRIDEARKELSSLKRWTLESLGKANQKDLRSRINQAEEKLTFWEGRMTEMNSTVAAQGGQVASADNVQIGGHVCYRGTWYPVIRVNKKTVTIGNWLGVETLKFKVDYAGISQFQPPSES